MVEHPDFGHDYTGEPTIEMKGILPNKFRKLLTWMGLRKPPAHPEMRRPSIQELETMRHDAAVKAMNEVTTEVPPVQKQDEQPEAPAAPEHSMDAARAQQIMQATTIALPQIRTENQQTGGHIKSDEELLEVRRNFRPIPNKEGVQHSPKHVSPDAQSGQPK